MFQNLKHILLLTTDYTGASKNVYCSRHQCFGLTLTVRDRL